MFLNKSLLIATAALALVVSVAAPAHAQRGRGPRVLVSRPVFVTPYYAPFYDPFYWDSFRWGYPGWYGPGPGFYNRGYRDDSAARIQVTPRHTEVYVDGYLAGVVDDFDGFAQRLRVSPGEHVIELYLDGHKTIEQKIMFQPGETYRIRHAMEPLAPGEVTPPRPAPRPGAVNAATTRSGYDAFGQPMGRVPPAGRDASALLIRVQPGDAVILVDGERWQGSGNDRLEVHVTPGEHRIDVQKDGYQPFSTSVRVRPGESAPVNISLTKSGEEQ